MQTDISKYHYNSTIATAVHSLAQSYQLRPVLISPYTHVSVRLIKRAVRIIIIQTISCNSSVEWRFYKEIALSFSLQVKLSEPLIRSRLDVLSIDFFDGKFDCRV